MPRGSTSRMGVRLGRAVLPVAGDAPRLDPGTLSLVRRAAGASFAMARPRGGVTDGVRRGSTSDRRSSVPTGRSDSVAGTAVAVRRAGDGSRYDPSSSRSPTGVRSPSDSDWLSCRRPGVAAGREAGGRAGEAPREGVLPVPRRSGVARGAGERVPPEPADG
jgi:hypothetical protein